MASINLAKRALRKEVKKKIAALTSKEKFHQSHLVANKIIKSELLKNSERISIYVSTDEEINTTTIMEAIFNLGKTCFIPRYSFDKIHMDMVKLHSMDDLERLPLTKWNIKQPSLMEARENALDTGGLDLIFIPGLAFTKDGKRLGRGKAFYDTYLGQCCEKQAKPPIKVGLAFAEQIFEDIPTDDHDIVLDHVVSCDSVSNDL
ncbi:5-formyltetrahydrofolate cyclo-ligase-like [Ischnura elegans]|uniref:5-formyltetrahydrofolate cyclo-ligase-like n=1 Tax=Ischnura elegans TaxID=197161 RepID=UPI001ED88287|nr:5-formyltetrahydrofolate cyclo-ligase-like [Ischnura elegans]